MGSGVVSAQLRLPGPLEDTPTPYDRDSVWPTQAVLDGLLAMGVRHGADSTFWQPASSPCPGTDGAGGGTEVGTTERNRLRLRARERLARGFRVEAELDTTVHTDKGEAGGAPGSACGRFFDARSSLTLSHPLGGAVSVGRLQHPAHELVLLADPWAGGSATVGGAGWRTYVTPQPEGTRSDGALRIAYARPEEPLRVAWQLGRPAPDVRPSYRSAGSVVWDGLPWLVGAGWQGLPDGDRVWPVVVAYDTGWQRISLSDVQGRTAAVRWQHRTLGWVARTAFGGKPAGLEWKAAFNEHRKKGAAELGWGDQGQLSAGARWHLRGRLWFDAAVVRRRTEAAAAGVAGDATRPSRTGVEVGLGWTFERDFARSPTRASIPPSPTGVPGERP